MYKKIITFISIFLLLSNLSAQIFIQADPFYLLEQEKNSFTNNNSKNFLIRPFLNLTDTTLYGTWSVGFRTELFYNDNAPNLENTSDRWIGKGMSFFQGIQLAYTNKFLSLSLEPYYFSNQNKDYTDSWQEYFIYLPDSIKNIKHPYTREPVLRYDQPFRELKFSKLNDNRPHGDEPYSKSGIREAQVYLHYNGLGIGYSNANMWWGSGYHSSLSMTNNTTGFPHLMIGTIKEQRIKDFGINFRYIFADSLKNNTAKPFFTALLGSITYYSNPTITLGFSRSYMTGGNRVTEKITRKEAMLIPFEALYLEDKQTDPDDPLSSTDIWDQILVGYLTATFPEVGLVIFIEYGRNDAAFNKEDFIRQPDHSGASVIGLRKYGFFNNPHLVGGIEYANLIKTKYWNDRMSADWYDRWNFDYWSYDGRHWGAHSGPDSDDFYFYFGYMDNKLTVIPSFNYERHGVIDNKIPEREYEYNPSEYPWLHIWGNGHIWPEVKKEYRIDVKYKYKNYLFNLYYEYEVIDNDQFRIAIRDGSQYAKDFAHRYSSVIWLGVERSFDKKELSRLINKYLIKN
ncbi:MAG: capsule assembly Wzi family protein [Candidatus Marinimicrobia bacterium]|nr:capsule assembly Wzi family protein [Candidatus Neomarinimicrobiota bacterium]